MRHLARHAATGLTALAVLSACAGGDTVAQGDYAPDYRGIGAGKALLKTIAQYAVQRQCGRLEWSVLDWNQPAIDFYLSIGAQPQDEWVRYRLTGDALRAFAE